MSVIRAAATGAVLLAAILRAQGAAQLTGTVTDATGSPVPGVIVRIIPLDRPFPFAFSGGVPVVPQAGSWQVSAATDSSGRYIMNSVPPGRYSVCVADTGLHLDPCLWGPSITVAVNGTAAVQQNVSVGTGVKLVVQIRDPHSVAKLNPATKDLLAFGSVSGLNGAKGIGLAARHTGPSIWEMEAVVPSEPGHAVQVSIPQNSFIQPNGTGNLASAGGVLSLPIPFNTIQASGTEPPLPRSPFGRSRGPTVVIPLELR